MVDENRSFAPGAVSSNRAQRQDLGVGQEELDKRQAPSRDPATNADRPSQADVSEEDVGGREPALEGEGPGAELDDRNAAGLEVGGGDLGAATPPNLDVHDLGQEDKPQEDWGEEVEEGALHSANNTRKGVRTEAERGQGAKTRRLNKDIVSRRV